MRFKNQFYFEQRLEESSRVLKKYPDRVPVICEKSVINSSNCPDIDKKKYLVPSDLTMGQFLYVIRKRLKLSSEKALFLFVGNVMVPSTMTLDRIYNTYRDNDGFLYITYSLENVFG